MTPAAFRYNSLLKEIYDFEIGCSVNPEDPSTLQTYIDDKGLPHHLQRVICPACGICLEMDMRKDARENDRQTVRIYSEAGDLILEAKE